MILTKQLVNMTKERILKVAREIFSKKGYDATTTQEIAEKAKVNKAMIYYYFRNKEDLYIEMLRNFFNEISSKLLNVFAMNLSPPEKFNLFISEYINFISKNRELPSLILGSILTGKKHVHQVIEEIMLPVYKKGERFFEEGKARGYFYDLDFKNLITTVIGAIVFYFIGSPIFSVIWEEDPLSSTNVEKKKKELIRLIEKGLIKKRREI